MKIIVTGVAGYIGGLLTPALLAEGHTVTAVDRLLYDPTSLNSCFAHKNFHFVRADVRDVRSYKQELAEADLFIPLACLVGAPVCDRNHQEAWDVNYGAVSDALCACGSEQRVLFPTTNSGYGQCDVPCTEDTPLNPLSIYATSKVEAEKAVLDRGNSVTFRLATAFGASPRMRFDLLVNQFVYKAVKEKSIVLYEPHFRRNFISVRDIVRVFLHAIDHPDMQGPYNVGLSDANLTKLELCQRIAQHIPDFDWFVGKGSDGDKRDYVVSNAKIEAAGFQCAHILDDGILELKKLYGALSNEKYGNV